MTTANPYDRPPLHAVPASTEHQSGLLLPLRAAPASPRRRAISTSLRGRLSPDTLRTVTGALGNVHALPGLSRLNSCFGSGPVTAAPSTVAAVVAIPAVTAQAVRGAEIAAPHGPDRPEPPSPAPRPGQSPSPPSDLSTRPSRGGRPSAKVAPGGHPGHVSPRARAPRPNPDLSFGPRSLEARKSGPSTLSGRSPAFRPSLRKPGPDLALQP